MKLELEIFNKKELVRACQLIGYKNKNGKLSKSGQERLKNLILKKINPDNHNLKDQYHSALKLFNLNFTRNTTEQELKTKLYKYNCKLLEKTIKKMSKSKKEKLTQKLESSLDPTSLDQLKKIGRKGVVTGSGVLVLQGGAILLTGSNLGICMLLTTGLSSISTILGITFPFSVYTGAAVLGGKLISVGHFLTNPFIIAPILGYTIYQAYRKVHNRQFVTLAGINYLIESKKLLND